MENGELRVALVVLGPIRQSVITLIGQHAQVEIIPVLALVRTSSESRRALVSRLVTRAPENSWIRCLTPSSKPEVTGRFRLMMRKFWRLECR